MQLDTRRTFEGALNPHPCTATYYNVTGRFLPLKTRYPNACVGIPVVNIAAVRSLEAPTNRQLDVYSGFLYI